MHAAPGICPICTSDLEVTRLHCRQCDTAIEGRFVLNRFAQLNEEQLAFVELFVQLEGKLNRLGQELDLSYTAVRARLSEVVEAFGDDVDEPPTVHVSAEKRMEILAMVQSGAISAETAVELLKG
ncbi:MAG: DUF2089 domain-containing protein [Candidatus Promineifilaceae bacterium]